VSDGITPEHTAHRYWMEQAIALAAKAGAAGDIPVGAIIVDRTGQQIATGENRRERDHDPTAHAEVIALRAAGQARGSWHLEDCTLYVTLEPCPMCAGAIVLARLGLLVYGADDPKAGAIRTILNVADSPASNHRLRVLPGVMESACRSQLQQWFLERRSQLSSPSPTEL